MQETKVREVTQLVQKYEDHLVARGKAILQLEEQKKASMGMKDAVGIAVFRQVLEGFLLTIAYAFEGRHQIGILDWTYTDIEQN